MSDSREDISIPKATVAKIIKDNLPVGFRCDAAAKGIVESSIIEFILLLSSEAHEMCEKEKKKTLTGEYVIAALRSLEFHDYVEKAEKVLNDIKIEDQRRKTNKNAMKDSELSMEELQQQQRKLFEAARQSFME